MNYQIRYLCAVTILWALTGCNNEKESKPQDITLSFSCTTEAEHLPPLDPQAEIWFSLARSMQKAAGEKNFDAIADLYRQAAGKDHYKAMINLQNMLTRRLAAPVKGKPPQEEVVAITERMMQINIPAGYYLMGHYLERGYGVKRDKTTALAYFRKAADLGNPEAQNYLGQLFLTEQFEDYTEPKTLRVHFKKNPAFNPKIGEAMLDCAASQGNGEAADWLAGWFHLLKTKDYSKAIKYYQLGVKNGNNLSALRLIRAFDSPLSEPDVDYLALDADPERVRRYTKIKAEINFNPSARFPDIDKIVPLPPEKLPDWDGTFEYKKAMAEK
ncbi:hypothetical protein EDF81_1906 [Enterobacter sp. BIGb0383]|uniref:SEL1-like repeat protein n=1 Tax=unclassified Enterobacter TaxID=2608935 RepID=UPI000F47D11D|nr:MULTISPECIES: DUF6396 domain-containing protein [unclassified Enterobacter]ROP59122.1 hypothetical protein EDF81_1906 [Enterobacter sp. BIGb0383]ROS09412.1 hypothetical protein EC848_2934 [Enterobacter sp. BIGb0359]